MNFLIVNADDFGASRGINRAVIELYDRGVLTSASLMIGMPAAREAVTLAANRPDLGLGLHVTLTEESGAPLVDFADAAGCAVEMRNQLACFQAALGKPPTHIDSHQNVHRDARLLTLFKQIAEDAGLPLREHSRVKYFSDFYGQWDGETHPEQISCCNLIRMLSLEKEDIVELSCHPGYVDPAFESTYHAEREMELQALSESAFLDFVCSNGIRLISFRDIARESNRL
jgi:chitin disaccharide deacetylase